MPDKHAMSKEEDHLLFSWFSGDGHFLGEGNVEKTVPTIEIIANDDFFNGIFTSNYILED